MSGTEQEQEFYDLIEVSPDDADDILLGRNREPRRSTVGALKDALSSGQSAIAFSKTPPTDKKLWWQLDDDGYPVDFWRKRSSGLWVGDQVYLISAFDTQVKRNRYHHRANPLPDEAVWIESLTAKGYAWDTMRNGDYIDFSLYRVDASQRSTKLHYLRLEDAERGQFFKLSEPVERVFAMDEALAFMLATQRRGQTKLRTTTTTVMVRRVYADR